MPEIVASFNRLTRVSLNVTVQYEAMNREGRVEVWQHTDLKHFFVADASSTPEAIDRARACVPVGSEYFGCLHGVGVVRELALYEAVHVEPNKLAGAEIIFSKSRAINA